MDIRTAYAIVGLQNKRIRTLDGQRFVHKGYEYEIRYEGGFATFVSLFRREIGRRNFKWFEGAGCADCMNAEAAFKKLWKLLPGEGV